jgi:hypothetical protein
MELHGCTAAESGAVQKPAYDLDQFPSDLPIDQISKIAQSAVSEATGATRSAKDAEIYKKISPAVVLVAGGLGPQLVPIPTQHVDIDAVSVHRPKSPVAGLRLEISVVVGRSK